MKIKYLSIFSGIEAASIALEPLGWEPLAFCENAEFPAAVLAARWPEVPNLGDIRNVDWSNFLELYGKPDLIIGGSPCTSFSIAGGRESLDGESRLMFEYVRAVGEVGPKWFIWENVPGAINTKDDAFGQFLSEMENLGYRVSWRVLDSQYFRVAQRRRRLFAVGCLAEYGFASAAVLFDSASVPWNLEKGSRKRQEYIAATQNGIRETGSGACASD